MVTDMSGHKMIFAHIGRFLNLMSYTCYFKIDKKKENVLWTRAQKKKFIQLCSLFLTFSKILINENSEQLSSIM